MVGVLTMGFIVSLPCFTLISPRRIAMRGGYRNAKRLLPRLVVLLSPRLAVRPSVCVRLVLLEGLYGFSCNLARH